MTKYPGNFKAEDVCASFTKRQQRKRKHRSARLAREWTAWKKQVTVEQERVEEITLNTCLVADDKWATRVLDTQWAYQVEEYDSRQQAKKGHAHWKTKLAKRPVKITIGSRKVRIKR